MITNECYLLLYNLFKTSDGSRSTAMDLGMSFGSTNKRLRMNGPSTDRNGQPTEDNNIGLSQRGRVYTFLTINEGQIFMTLSIYICISKKYLQIGKYHFYRP